MSVCFLVDIVGSSYGEYYTRKLVYEGEDLRLCLHDVYFSVEKSLNMKFPPICTETFEGKPLLTPHEGGWLVGKNLSPYIWFKLEEILKSDYDVLLKYLKDKFELIKELKTSEEG